MPTALPPAGQPLPEFADFLKAFPGVNISDPHRTRKLRAARHSPQPLPVGEGFTIERITIRQDEPSALSALLVRPAKLQGLAPVLLYAHGGGFVVGDAAGDLGWQTKLAAEHGVATLGVDYRLSPETVYPGAVDDLLAAWGWLSKHGASFNVDKGRSAIGGSSAGGCLASLASLELAQTGGATQPKLVLLAWPMLDDRVDQYSHPHEQHYIFGLQACRDAFKHFGLREAGGAPPVEQELAAFPALPPHHFILSELDSVTPAASTYIERLRSVGVATSSFWLHGAPHDVLTFCPDTESAGKALDSMVRALQEALY